jgi:AcrR family transcriptional regulator
MPARTQRRHRQGIESRQRILEAALSIAVERGYDGTTMALVTERAELPASSVYWQFKNKDDLLAEALDHSYRRWRTEGPTWQSGSYTGTPRERIRARLGYSLDSVEQELEYWRLGLTLAMLQRPGGIAAQDRFIAVRGETRRIVRDWWAGLDLEAAAADPALIDSLASLYLAFVDGMFVAYRADHSIPIDAVHGVVSEAMADLREARAAAGPQPARRSPRKRAQPVRMVEESRAKLLDAAAQVAAEQGYRGTTIKRVCSRAGLPVSSLYWFFDDKDHLLAEVVGHSWDEWQAGQPSWVPPDDPSTWPLQLRRILDGAVRSLVDAPSFLRIGIMLTLEGDDVAARDRFLEIRRGILARIREWFEAVLPAAALASEPALPALLAQTVVAFTDGYFLGVQIDGREPSVAVFVDLVVDLITAAADRAAGNATSTRG